MPKDKYQPAGVCMVPCRTRLGKFLRLRRLALDLRQVQIAKIIQIDQRAYSKIEVGHTKWLTTELAQALSKVLGCKQSLLESLGQKKPKPKKEPLPRTKLGKLIRTIRERLDLTIAQLAKRLGTSNHYVSMHEVGNNKILLSRLDLWANALECDPDLLRPYTGQRGWKF